MCHAHRHARRHNCCHNHRHFTWYDGLNRLPQPQLPVPPLIGSAFDLRPLFCAENSHSACVLRTQTSQLQPFSPPASEPSGPPVHLRLPLFLPVDPIACGSDGISKVTYICTIPALAAAPFEAKSWRGNITQASAGVYEYGSTTNELYSSTCEPGDAHT